MNFKIKLFTLLPILVVGGLAGDWLGLDFEEPGGSPARLLPQPPLVASPEAHPAEPRDTAIYQNEFRDSTTIELLASSRPNEVILRFPSASTYQDFFILLSGSQLQLVDQLDPLRAMRIAFDDWQELAMLLQSENMSTYDALTEMPAPSPVQVGAQEGALGFGESMIHWLGITTDHRRWGAGVKIAVIDSGIVPHTALPRLRKSIAITPFPADLSKTNGHGTAVASLIAGNDPAAMGVAPAAELVSIRVGDEEGKADSFALAAGILAALDEGVHLINISMGTSEDNPLIEEAVMLAEAQGVLIVAASGNSEQSDASYPAAYPSVISVGAVDARGAHLDFSNFGTYLSITAPGYALRCAQVGGGLTTLSGTSASAPIVTGAIAATMSAGSGIQMTARQAVEIVMQHADDAGIPGPDTEYGVGILNMARVMNRTTPGLIDAAITSQRLVRSSSPGGTDTIQITLQNRGTAPLFNTRLDLATSIGNRQFFSNHLAPGETQTFSLAVYHNGHPPQQAIRVTSEIHLGSHAKDFTPHNNQASEVLAIP